MPVGSREAFITTSFGLVGASIVYDKLVCYSISSDSKNVNRIYEEDVEQMLFKRPDLLERYRNENRRDRTSARTVIKYLREAGLTNLLKKCNNIFIGSQFQMFSQSMSCHTDCFGRVAGNESYFFGRKVHSEQNSQILFSSCNTRKSFFQSFEKALFCSSIWMDNSSFCSSI